MNDIRRIIKSDLGTYDINEYNQNKLNNKINEYEKNQNEIDVRNKISTEFLNLSLNEVFKNFTNTLIMILDDLVLFIDNYFINKKKKEDLIVNLLRIFIIKDRLIYVGMFFILLSFFIYFMDVSY